MNPPTDRESRTWIAIADALLNIAVRAVGAVGIFLIAAVYVLCICALAGIKP